MNKCPKCGSNNIDEGKLAGGGSLYLEYLSKKSKLLNKKGCSTKAYICLRCGYIELYADEKNFEKFKGKIEEEMYK